MIIYGMLLFKHSLYNFKYKGLYTSWKTTKSGVLNPFGNKEILLYLFMLKEFLSERISYSTL